MQTLTYQEKEHLLKRFPNLKLSYETFAHKKVSNDYDIGIALPYGPKAYIWFTFYENKQVCVVGELTRNQEFGDKVYIENIPIPADFVLGTIVSGIFVEENICDYHDMSSMTCSGTSSTAVSSTNSSTYRSSDNLIQQHTQNIDIQEESIPKQRIFVIENIYTLKGYSIYSTLQPIHYAQKIKHIVDFCHEMDIICSQTYSAVHFCVPYMWKYDETIHTFDSLPVKNLNIPYDVKHIQYMSSMKILPILNVSLHKKPVWNMVNIAGDDNRIPMKGNNRIWNTKYVSPPVPDWKLNFNNHLYRKNCYFWVKADVSYDVYHLYAKKSKPHCGDILYQYAFVKNIETSMLLNGIFRNIKENKWLDAVEESDDDEEFENVQEDRFVDLHKKVLMECEFSCKFKKWTPLRIAHADMNGFKVVPYLDQLIMR